MFVKLLCIVSVGRVHHWRQMKDSFIRACGLSWVGFVCLFVYFTSSECFSCSSSCCHCRWCRYCGCCVICTPVDPTAPPPPPPSPYPLCTILVVEFWILQSGNGLVYVLIPPCPPHLALHHTLGAFATIGAAVCKMAHFIISITSGLTGRLINWYVKCKGIFLMIASSFFFFFLFIGLCYRYYIIL